MVGGSVCVCVCVADVGTESVCLERGRQGTRAFGLRRTARCFGDLALTSPPSPYVIVVHPLPQAPTDHPIAGLVRCMRRRIIQLGRPN